MSCTVQKKSNTLCNFFRAIWEHTVLNFACIELPVGFAIGGYYEETSLFYYFLVVEMQNYLLLNYKL